MQKWRKLRDRENTKHREKENSVKQYIVTLLHFSSAFPRVSSPIQSTSPRRASNASCNSFTIAFAAAAARRERRGDMKLRVRITMMTGNDDGADEDVYYHENVSNLWRKEESGCHRTSFREARLRHHSTLSSL